MISQPGGIFEVSVIIPAHNDETRLPRAIRSVLGQSLPVSEIVVVDDGSEDRTAEVAASFPKTICLRQKNSGAAGARNAGIARARSEWIAFLDSDDEWTPDHIKNAWSLIQGQPGIAWYFCPYEKKSESGRLISVLELKNAVPSNRVIEDYFLIEAKGDSAGFTSCMIIRKRVLDEVGGFNEELRVVLNDVDLCLRIRQKGYLIVYEPGALLYHYEGSSRGLLHPAPDQRRFEELWDAFLDAGDPYYNVNLSDRHDDWSIRV